VVIAASVTTVERKNYAFMTIGEITSTIRDMTGDPYYYSIPNTFKIMNFDVQWNDYLIKPTKPTMKTLPTMFKKLADADTQALALADFINGDLQLTSLGKDELLAIIFDANKAALVAAAKARIAETQKTDA
jgi:hypothetical protein